MDTAYVEPEYEAYRHGLCRDRTVNRVFDQEGIDSERCVLLNRQRAGYASHFTKRLQAFERVINESAAFVCVEEHLESLEMVFRKFSDKHEDYMRVLATVKPGKTTEARESYTLMAGQFQSAACQFQRLKLAMDLRRSIRPEDSYRSSVSRGSSALTEASAKQSETEKSRFVNEKQERVNREEIRRLKMLKNNFQQELKQLKSEILELEVTAAQDEPRGARNSARKARGNTAGLSWRDSARCEFGAPTVSVESRLAAETRDPRKAREIRGGKSQTHGELSAWDRDSQTGLKARPSTAALDERVQPEQSADVSTPRGPTVPEVGGASVCGRPRIRSNTFGDYLSDCGRQGGPGPAVGNSEPYVTPFPQPIEGVLGHPQILQLQQTPRMASHGYQPRYHSMPVVMSDSASYSVLLQRHMLDIMELPRTDMGKFDGDPLRFWTFVRTFDACVHNTTVSDADKLNCLMQHCTGKAANVIQSCALMDPSQGYNKASTLLQKRFGEDYGIAKAWINKITCGLPVKPHS